MDDSANERERLEAPGAESAEWVAGTRRLAPMVDGVEYYRSLRQALIEAREQVLIVGWEFHSEIDLLRGEEADRAAREGDWPVRLADLLERLVREREGLRVWILIWEGASLFALERQHLPRMKRPWAEHPRIQLAWDRDVPQLASQHEKTVVIDDRVAFAGGMDLTKSRWDDHEHAPNDERRRNPGLIASLGDPYHDLMLALDGGAARVLGEWCRERWRRATGERLDPPSGAGEHDPWPSDLEPLLRDRPLAIVRTQPAWGGRLEKRQVEAAYLAQIRSARKLLFIETQYVSHEEIVEALVERLREPDGPEIVMILPYGCPGRLQSIAMDPRRDTLLERLRAADPGGRLGVYWPTLNAGSEESVHEHAVYVHAKTMVVDDRLLRIGSSNMNNRSMGLDTEIDLFTQVGEDEGEAIEAIAGYRRRLLAYLLHVEPERVAEAERARGSVVAAIEALRGGRRTLQAFEHRADGWLHSIELPIELADPASPLSDEDAERILEAIEADKRLVERARKGANVAIGGVRRWRWSIAIGAVLLAIVLAWRYTPLRSWTDAEAVRGAVETVRASPAGVAGVLAAFLVLTTVGFPVTVLVATVGATFDVRWAIPICLLGVGGSSLLGFYAGRVLPWRTGMRFFGARLERVAERCADRGVLAVAIVRNVPLAPFVVVNLACGMIGLSSWSFLAGTIIGMLPGILLIVLFGQEIGEWIVDPTLGGLLKLAAIAALVVGVGLATDFVLRRFAAGRRGDPDTGTADA